MYFHGNKLQGRRKNFLTNSRSLRVTTSALQHVLTTNVNSKENTLVTQHIERYQLSADWILSYGDAKSKYLIIYRLKVDFEISHTSESSMPNLKVT